MFYHSFHYIYLYKGKKIHVKNGITGKQEKSLEKFFSVLLYCHSSHGIRAVRSTRSLWIQSISCHEIKSASSSLPFVLMEIMPNSTVATNPHISFTLRISQELSLSPLSSSMETTTLHEAAISMRMVLNVKNKIWIHAACNDIVLSWIFNSMEKPTSHKPASYMQIADTAHDGVW